MCVKIIIAASFKATNSTPVVELVIANFVSVSKVVTFGDTFTMYMKPH